MFIHKKKLLIFGTGTLGEVAGYYFLRDSPFELIGFVDTVDYVERRAEEILGVPVLEFEEAQSRYSPGEVCFFVAIGYKNTNKLRQKRYEQIRELGYKFASYISPRADVFTNEIGQNCFILEGNVLQPFSKIGDNVFMWSGNHLGHHSVVQDNVFISSHVVVSGNCVVGANSFLGVNACLYDGVSLGAMSVVSPGSIVSQSCEVCSVFKTSGTVSRVIRKSVI